VSDELSDAVTVAHSRRPSTVDYYGFTEAVIIDCRRPPAVCNASRRSFSVDDSAAPDDRVSPSMITLEAASFVTPLTIPCSSQHDSPVSTIQIPPLKPPCRELVYWFNDVVIFGSDCDRFSSDNKGTGIKRLQSMYCVYNSAITRHDAIIGYDVKYTVQDKVPLNPCKLFPVLSLPRLFSFFTTLLLLSLKPPAPAS